MRRRLITLFILITMVIPTSVLAQGTVTLNNLTVTLWPEFDQPSMLVIHEFTFTEDTLLPFTMDFRFPSDANITAAAYNTSDGLLLANYQAKESTDTNWQTITLFITEPAAYRVEYYQPLPRSGNNRSFNYQWAGDYAVKNFDIEIRVPGDSANIKTTPAIPFTQQDPFLSGGAMMSGLDEGQSYRLQLEYTRTSEALTASESSQVEPITPVDENTDGRSTLANLPLFLGGFGFLLIAAGVFYYLRGQSGKHTGKPRKRQHTSSPDANSQIYCHECGTRAQTGDRFCRTCGSKLRP